MNKLILSLILSTTIYSCPTLKDDIIQTMRDTKESQLTIELVEAKQLTMEEGISKITEIKKKKENLVTHVLKKHAKDNMAMDSIQVLIEETIYYGELLRGMKEANNE